MKAQITINMDNAAFEDTPEIELGRILEKLSRSVQSQPLSVGNSILLRDVNGNRVGELTIEE